MTQSEYKRFDTKEEAQSAIKDNHLIGLSAIWITPHYSKAAYEVEDLPSGFYLVSSSSKKPITIQDYNERIMENINVEVVENELGTVSTSPVTAKVEIVNAELYDNSYIPASTGCRALDTVVPASMRYELHKALQTIDRRVNGVDMYVAERLGFVTGNCSIEQKKEGLKCLCDAYGAEQVDAIATAIWNIENRGQGIIVGDQTGLGKGRVAAALLRYGIMRGKQPIFISEKPNLFTDIMRDIIDIGSDDAIPLEFFSALKEVKKSSLSAEELEGLSDSENEEDDMQDEINSEYFKKETYVKNKNYDRDVRGKKRVKPFIVNGRGNKTHVKDENGNILYKGLSSSETMNIIEAGKVPKEFKAIFATYSQFRGKIVNKKMEFLMKLAQDNIIVMDECFVPDSKLDGVAIKDIKLGDLVRSYNHEVNSVEYKEVKRLYRKAVTEIVKVALSNGVVHYVTGNHPYFSPEQNNYVPVSELFRTFVVSITPNEHEAANSPASLQDRCGEFGLENSGRGGRVFSQGVSSSGAGQKKGEAAERVRVESIEVLKRGGSGEFERVCPEGIVYNIEVSDNNNYFVDNILVHNCHNASGDSNTGVFLRKVLESTLGVCFLSATFAKRPDNMPIYAGKTAISDANLTSEDLVAAIKNGGVALQEVMSSQLVSEGQMIRRERSFEGIEVNFMYLDSSQDAIGHPNLNKEAEHKAIFDRTTKVIRDIIEFQANFVKPFIKILDKMHKAELGEVEQRKGTAAAGISNPPEFSGIFNIISQLLFSLKAESVAEVTIRRLKEGKKPVIAFANTMESFLDNIVNDNGEPVEIGDVIYADFAEVLKRRLDGVMKYTVTAANGEKEYKSITLMEVDDDFKEAYNTIAQEIKKTVTGISISPIDVVRQKIEEAGFTTAEVTGRDRMLKLKKDQTAMVMRKPQISATDAFRKFNNNEVDCLMINRSGSTGASAHAIKTDKVKNVRKDAEGKSVIPNSLVPREEVKQRVMIILQAELDINTEVQKRGRINRTGQEYKPIYDYVISAIPAEQRLMMMLQKKLKSLDANTTSNQKQSTKILDIPDFLNKYGDEEVEQWCIENPLLNKMMDDPLKLNAAGEDGKKKDSDKGTDVPNAAHKVSGRVAILSIEDQERFYSEMTDRYNSTVEYKRQSGEYDLEVENCNLESETISKQVIAEGKAGATSVFGRNTILEKCRVNVLKKPYTKDELENLLKAELGGLTPDEKADKQIAEFTAFVDAKYEEEKKDTEQYYAKLVEGIFKEKGYLKLDSAGDRKEYEETRKEGIEEGKDAALRRIEIIFKNKKDVMLANFKFFKTGKVIAYPSATYKADNMWYKGVFIGFDIKKTMKNPYAPSAVKLRIALANSMKYLSLPASKFDITTGIKGLTYENIMTYEQDDFLDQWDEITKASTGDREVRYIITGNILQGFGKLQQKAKLISYTLKDGGVKKGILLPFGFDPNGSGRDPKQIKVTVPIMKALKIIKSMLVGRSMATNDNLSIIRKADGFMISVPLNRKLGGKYYENNILQRLTVEKTFNKLAAQMVATVEDRMLDNLVQFLQDEYSLSVELNQTEYGMIGGGEAETDYDDEVDYNRGAEVIQKITAEETEFEQSLAAQEGDAGKLEFEEQEAEQQQQHLVPIKMKLKMLSKLLGLEKMEKGGAIGSDKNSIEIELSDKSMDVKNYNGLLAAQITILRALQRDYIGAKSAKESKAFAESEFKKRIKFTGKVTPEKEQKAIDHLSIDILDKALGNKGLIFESGGQLGVEDEVNFDEYRDAMRAAGYGDLEEVTPEERKKRAFDKAIKYILVETDGTRTGLSPLGLKMDYGYLLNKV